MIPLFYCCVSIDLYGIFWYKAQLTLLLICLQSTHLDTENSYITKIHIEI